MEEELMRPLAWQALREWLASPNYREVAKADVVWAATSLGQEIERRRVDQQQWWDGPDGERLSELRRGVWDFWLNSGWLRLEQARLGRPRRSEYSHQLLRKAWRLYNYGGPQAYRPDGTYRWAESVLGERKKYGPTKLAVVSDAVYSELLMAAGEDTLEGLSRAQVAEVLDLPKTASDRFCRWLLKTGQWSEAKTKKSDGSRESVLRRLPQ